MKWAMWNADNYQRIINIDTGTFFTWHVGNNEIGFCKINESQGLWCKFKTPEETAKEWGRIKATIFQDAE